MSLPRTYPIVDSAQWVARLLPAGVRLIQLRIKDRPVEEIRREIRQARDLCAAASAQLVVNDYWQLALEEGCDYVHLGQEDLNEADVGALKRAGIQLGVSTHSDEELDRALSLSPDYVALGPVYPTVLKVMPWAPQGLPKVTEWKRRVAPLPLVAIGGLTLERLPGVLASGADVAAVVTDIVRHPNPEARARAWVELAGS